jgi:hypothetical protein
MSFGVNIRTLGAVFAASLVAAVAGKASAEPAASAEVGRVTSATDVQCEIRTKSEDGLLRIEAIARTGHPIEGRYSFFIVKQSAAGTSQNQQSGSFSARPGREQVLTTVVLDGSAAGHCVATLSLDWGEGSLSCRLA